MSGCAIIKSHSVSFLSIEHVSIVFHNITTSGWCKIQTYGFYSKQINMKRIEFWSMGSIILNGYKDIHNLHFRVWDVISKKRRGTVSIDHFNRSYGHDAFIFLYSIDISSVLPTKSISIINNIAALGDNILRFKSWALAVTWDLYL